MKQSELQHRIKILTKHGKTEEAQEILAPLDCGPAMLDQFKADLLDWNNTRRLVKELMRQQKQATQDQEAAHDAASILVTKFKRAARLIFKNNEPVLTLLGLYPPLSKTKKSTNGTTADAGQSETELEQTNGNGYIRRPSYSTAAKIDRWHMMFSKALELSEADLALLAKRGWTTERLAEALALVEAYAEADIDQQQKIKDQREAASAASAAADALETRYLEMRSHIKAEIADLPPKKRARIEELLGL